MKIPIAEVRTTMIEALERRGLTRQDASVITDDLLDAEMSGYRTHGIGKITVINDALAARIGRPVITRDSAVHAAVDGRRELGQLAAQFCADLAITKARDTGIGIVSLTNASRYGRLAPYVRKIAAAGFSAMVANSGGPSAVAPHGTYRPILGTNPIAFAFPSRDSDVITIDFSTSKAVWGEIRMAMLQDKPLPAETFYNADGQYTRDPADAEAVMAMDEAKGYSLCLAIELLCGAMIGGSMGLRVETEYDLGFLFLAISPSLFREDLEGFHREVESLKSDIVECPPLAGHSRVYIPGQRASASKAMSLESGVLDIDDGTWRLVMAMAEDPRAGLGTSDKTN